MPDFSDNLRPLHDGAEILTKERARSQINVDELAKHLLSRDGFLERQARVTKVLESDSLFSKKQNLNLSRPVGDTPSAPLYTLADHVLGTIQARAGKSQGAPKTDAEAEMGRS